MRAWRKDDAFRLGTIFPVVITFWHASNNRFLQPWSALRLPRRPGHWQSNLGQGGTQRPLPGCDLDSGAPWKIAFQAGLKGNTRWPMARCSGVSTVRSGRCRPQPGMATRKRSGDTGKRIYPDLPTHEQGGALPSLPSLFGCHSRAGGNPVLEEGCSTLNLDARLLGHDGRSAGMTAKEWVYPNLLKRRQLGGIVECL